MAVKTKTRPDVSIKSKRLALDGGLAATLHFARFNKKEFKPKVVVMNSAERLLDYCQKHEINHAISGGFFARDSGVALGEIWISGNKVPAVDFAGGWNNYRGAVGIDEKGQLKLAAFNDFSKIGGDLLQAGPLLVKNGKSLIKRGVDPEGFSATSADFDSDITAERHPRAAIGVDNNFIWLVACDGRAKAEAGLFLHEFADVLVEMGIRDALNVDGGSSASLIADAKLLNKPRTDQEIFKRGRPVHNAVVLRPAEV